MQSLGREERSAQRFLSLSARVPGSRELAGPRADGPAATGGAPRRDKSPGGRAQCSSSHWLVLDNRGDLPIVTIELQTFQCEMLSLSPQRTRRTQRKGKRKACDSRERAWLLGTTRDNPCADFISNVPPGYFSSSIGFSSGTADTALAEPSGAGGGASVHFPRSAEYFGNVSVHRSASSAVRADLEAWFDGHA